MISASPQLMPAMHAAGERLAQRLNLLRLPSDAERVGRLLD
jgi:hypothetical protein